MMKNSTNCSGSNSALFHVGFKLNYDKYHDWNKFNYNRHETITRTTFRDVILYMAMDVDKENTENEYWTESKHVISKYSR